MTGYIPRRSFPRLHAGRERVELNLTRNRNEIPSTAGRVHSGVRVERHSESGTKAGSIVASLRTWASESIGRQQGQGSLRDALGIVKNVSAGGFGILLQRELSRGELISVETAEGSLQCVIRHVKQTPRGLLTGAEVMAASNGSNHRRSLDNLKIALATEEKGAEECGILGSSSNISCRPLLC